MKLAVLGGGGVRMPAFVRAVLSGGANIFDEISLFEPDPVRRQTTARLAVEVADALGHPGVVRVTADSEEAFTDASFVFSAIRVGGDQGRVIDEEVALRRGLVGQETTGPGGAAMALRTIPVVLSYCDSLARCSPDAVLINFTNPAGIITQALSLHGRRAGGRGVRHAERHPGAAGRLSSGPSRIRCRSCTPGSTTWAGSPRSRVEGEERIGELIGRYEELQRFDHRFAAFDAAVVRRVGAIPTEYVFYYYDPQPLRRGRGPRRLEPGPGRPALERGAPGRDRPVLREG